MVDNNSSCQSMTADDVLDILDENYNWMMEHVKPQYIDALEGLYNMIWYDIWRIRNSPHTTVKEVDDNE